MVRPNGVITNYEYNDAGWLIFLRNVRSNGEVISSFSYTYDNVGNRISMENESGSVTWYSYDPLNQLVNVTYPDGQFEIFEYDRNGNRLSVTDLTGTTHYSYDIDNRLLSSTLALYEYDDNGNLIKKVENGEITKYQYNHRNIESLHTSSR